MAKGNILLVEDELAQQQLVAGILEKSGYQVSVATSVEEALEQFDTKDIDLVLSDWKLDGNRDGLELLKEVRQREKDVAFVMVTAYGTIARAVEAVRAGADDYLPKPFEKDALLLMLQRSLRARDLLAENRRLNEALTDRDRLVDLVGKAPTMQKIYRQLQKVARTEATVLLTGESGTGKELAARALHKLSPRSGGPFVAVNCAAIPEGLMESEFFGAVKGAYSGAHSNRQGKFAAAHGGILFLDEVGELPQELQPKLLRVLQEKKVVAVGDTKETSVDARVVAATNRQLRQEVASGRFREDLFYRLNVVPLNMPPLRQRREDIPMLLEHFILETTRKHHVDRPEFPSQLTRRLLDHGWPGNVRELANTIERLVLLSEDGSASMDDLPQNFEVEDKSEGNYQLPAAGISWDALERDFLGQALQQSHGNRTRAAALLGMPYRAFLYRLEKYELK